MLNTAKMKHLCFRKEFNQIQKRACTCSRSILLKKIFPTASVGHIIEVRQKVTSKNIPHIFCLRITKSTWWYVCAEIL